MGLQLGGGVVYGGYRSISPLDDRDYLFEYLKVITKRNTAIFFIEVSRLGGRVVKALE